MRTGHRLIVVALVLATFAIVFVRLARTEDVGADVLPQRHRELTLTMRLFGHGADAVVRAKLPVDTDRQSVRDEVLRSGRFSFHIERDGLNREGVWERQAADGPHTLTYTVTVRTQERRFELAPRIERSDAFPPEVQPYLRAGYRVQSDHPEIVALLESLVPPAERDNVTAILRAAYEYTRGTIRPAAFTGTTDAVTCLRLGEGSCGGKSRLMAALLRAGGVPARLVGGLILKDSTWQSTHVWVEAWIRGHWVPFCPLNGYWAEVPEQYLILYHGDEPMFVHSTDINFQYQFHAKRILAPPAEWLGLSGLPPLGAVNLWAAFEEVRIPVDLLKVILMLPFGALVVVIFRNVIGIETFGTFMPALMAVAFRDTGLLWGALLFLAILAVGAGVRAVLGRYQLLHTPRLAVILTCIVMFILAVALFGVTRGAVLPTRVSLFPLAILTLTTERFAVMLEEDGARRTGVVVAGTLLVVAAAYAVMEWEPLQVLVLAFPETLLLVVAAFFVAGRWVGMRATEFLRFREFLAAPGPGGPGDAGGQP